MSAPVTQNTANGATQSPQQNGKPRSNGRSTPQDGNRGYEGGDANGYNGKQQPKGNPSYKKGWQAKSDQTGANGQEDQRRKQGDANSPQGANGEKRHDSRDGRRNNRPRGEKNFSNQPPAQPEPVQPAQPAPVQPTQVVQPNVDRLKVEESKRLNSLIPTSKVDLTADQRSAIAAVKQAVPQAPDTDIQQTLEKFNWDTNRAAEWFHEHPGANSWSEVVRKSRKEAAAQPTPPAQQQERPRRDRSDRPEKGDRSDRSDKSARREERRNGQERYPANQQPAQANQPQQAQPQQQAQTQPAQHVQQAQQVQQAHQQQAQPQQPHYHQQQLQQQYYHQQQQQYYQQMQQQQQQPQLDAFSVADGEQLIMGFSKAIEVQLAEIAKRSSLLLQMQTELANIHAADKNQLTSLHEEKTTLLEQKSQLQHQLRQIEERLVTIDDTVERTEQEKLLKIQDWQRRSAALAVLGSQHLLTNQ